MIVTDQDLTPGLATDVSISTTFVNREINLVEEGFDLALRVGKLEDSNLVSRAIGRFPLALVASPGYLHAHGKPAHPKDLVHHNWLINTLTQAPRRWSFQDGRRTFSVKVEGRCDANDDQMLQSLACAGEGIAYLPAYFVDGGVRKGELIPLLASYLPDPCRYRSSIQADISSARQSDCWLTT